MKIEQKWVASDYTLSEVREAIIELWGTSANLDWLWRCVYELDFLTIVNNLHKMYFCEQKDYTLERIIEDAVMIVCHKQTYTEILSIIKDPA